jgi:hypothetical protein
VVTAISLDLPTGARERGYCAIADMDLMGEIARARAVRSSAA